MTIAYRFGAGSDPSVADTDGDGLNDGVEAAIGTSALYADTDLDGLSDNWEKVCGLDPLSASGDDGADGDPDNDFLSNIKESEYGTSPFSPDCDNDGLCDGEETGGVFISESGIPWLTFDMSEDITNEILTNSYRCAFKHTFVPLDIQGRVVSNLTISANGAIYLNKAGCENQGYSVNSSGFTYSLGRNAFVVAPWLDYIYIRDDIKEWETSIRFGTATDRGVGYLLIEYANVYMDSRTWQTCRHRQDRISPIVSHLQRLDMLSADGRVMIQHKLLKQIPQIPFLRNRISKQPVERSSAYLIAIKILKRNRL